jgi:cell division protein FtsW (lipid II flippase)
MSTRTRELGFLVPGLLIGLLGIATVASARADALEYGPLPGLAAVVGVFLAMHLALRWRAPLADPYLLPLVAALVAIGLVELDRISPTLARDQVVWIAIGGAVFVGVVVFLRDPHVLERYRYLIGLGGVALLIATMIFGTTINGSRLWIELPGGQTIQLTELSKVLIVIFLAGYLRDKRELLAIPTRRIGRLPVPPIAALGPAILVLVASLLVIAILNDFGSGILFFGVFIAMLYLATGRATYPLIGAAGMVIGAALVWLAVPRIQDRVDAWLFPFDDAQGLGFQSVQSIYALAEGGVIGPGLGRGFLVTADGMTVIPALETDFIFSAVSNELGYIGGVGLLLCYALMVQRGFSIAISAKDGFSKLLAGGLTALIGIQAILIVGGVVRLIPLTGVTLPFMSYGGSSVVTNFGLIAILLVLSHRARAEATGRRA